MKCYSAADVNSLVAKWIGGMWNEVPFTRIHTAQSRNWTHGPRIVNPTAYTCNKKKSIDGYNGSVRLVLIWDNKIFIE